MAGELPFGWVPSGELTAYTPTLRERAADWLRPMLFSDDRAGQDKANRLVNWGETMIPPFGFATSAYDAGRAGGEGDYLTAGTLGAMAMVPGGRKIKSLKGEKINPPREFYRGTNPESTERISTGKREWDSYLFAADNIPAASMYGRSIEKIAATPDAKILYEGTAEWNKVAGKWRKDENMLQYADRAAKAARAAGYDAVWFKRQGDVGTAIFNPNAFIRNVPDTPKGGK